MPDLTPITALGGHAPRVTEIGSLVLREVKDLGIASVALRRGATGSKVASMLGVALPGPLQVSEGSTHSALWIGPDQYFVFGSCPPEDDFARRLKAHIGDEGSVTEQTGAWLCFDVEGDNAMECLELICNLDQRRMREGYGTRTSIHHLGCYVMICPSIAGFRVFGPSASAETLYDAIETASRTVWACSQR